MPTSDQTSVYQAIARCVDSNAELIRHWPLTGGVSAEIVAIEYTVTEKQSAAQARQIVVRRHASGEWKLQENNLASTEYALQSALFKSGHLVPEPLFLDTSCELLLSPYFVMALVEGTTTVNKAQLPDALVQMANFLSSVHSLEVDSLSLLHLPRREDPIAGALEYLPQTMQWESLRTTIANFKLTPVKDSLLHGDFWPGNILWKDNNIAAVIDWEDAAIGTAVSDLACARVEIMTMYGQASMEAFTAQYLSKCAVDTTDLHLWGVYVSAAALATMSDWGLSNEEEASRRASTNQFLTQAAEQLSHQVKT